MDSYQLKNIDDQLWKRVQHRAIDEGLTVKALIVKALEQYLKT